MTLAVALSLAAAASTPVMTVQIAIVRRADSAILMSEGSTMLAQPGVAAKPFAWQGNLTLRPRNGGLLLDDLSLKSETRLIPEAGTSIRVGPHRYRSTLILRLEPGQTVTIIEEASIEEYLEGVLPHEMDPDWPLEALKAQAVVARTFTYANMGKFRKDGFDLTADTRSQVYTGMSAVNENVRAAVRQTRGEVLGWKGKLLRAHYHACCGGSTTDVNAAWTNTDEIQRPLRGVRDPWCSASPHMRWTAYFAWDDLAAAISQHHLSGPIQSLRIGTRDAAGYIRTFLIKSAGKTTVLKAAGLRGALGAGEMKSVRIKSVKRLRNGVEFNGAGSGHGVGLCQWGARLQASKGRSYGQILKFYFPGAELAEIDE